MADLEQQRVHVLHILIEPRKWPGPCISCDVSASDQSMYSMGKFCKEEPHRYFHGEGAKEIQSDYRK